MKIAGLFFTLLTTLCTMRHTNASLNDGVYAASLTPLNADLSCNYEELFSHCLDLIQRGCSGIVLGGTTGEGPSFSTHERIEMLEKIIQAGIPPQHILLANGASNISETVELCQAALKWDLPALLICPPSFYKNVSHEAVIAYYREIIQKVADSRLRVLLYHIPQFSGVPITLPIIQALTAEFPEIVIGIKESEGNFELTKDILKGFPGFKVFVGHEKQILEAVHLGGSGSICGIANLYPELIVSLYEMGKQEIRPENPQELNVFFEAMKGLPFISAFKAVMENRKGDIWHRLRPPLMPLTEEQRASFIATLEE
ncbi:MAG: dihydrodipicolinate synthase family protein [Rhabdochlamydiaceae bacterium]|nr:dihydrodipicolinate synthase family protein [Rhabdochlamydiaceae bacterium]